MAGENKTPRIKVGAGIAAFVLWAITAIIGLLEINIIIDMALRVYAGLWGDNRSDYWGGVVLRQVLLILLGISWMALVIGGGEYHSKWLGQPKSWKLFRRTIAVEISILALALYI